MDNSADFFLLPFSFVWDWDNFLFDLLEGGFKPTAPFIISQATASCVTDL